MHLRLNSMVPGKIIAALVVFLLCAEWAAADGCDQAAVDTIKLCAETAQKNVDPADMAADLSKMCSFYQATTKCYTPECCKDAEYSKVVELGLNVLREQFKNANVTCDLKCGSASRHMWSMANVLMAAMAAMLIGSF